MSDPIDRKLADNLRRWQASGQPQQWCAAHEGQWSHTEWQALLSTLWWSDYWPMEPAAVRAVLDAEAKPWNLRRWQASGQAWQWLDARGGTWNHDDWLALHEALHGAGFWPMDTEALGALLEELRPLWCNQQRWKASGLPQRWVELRQGAWNHADWLALVDTLQQSDFWPLDLTTVGQTLEAYKSAYHNLIRWQLSGHPQRWVEARQGQWDDSAWQSLLAGLAQSEFWPLEPSAIARVMEGHQREWWNLRRWRDAGLARRWVEAHEGRWNHDDWLALLAALRASGYWPIEPAALGRLLEETRAEWSNLRRWQASGQPQQWASDRAGVWGSDELQELLNALWETEYWPLDARAVQDLLQELDREEIPVLLPARRPRDEPAVLRFTAASGRRAA